MVEVVEVEPVAVEPVEPVEVEVEAVELGMEAPAIAVIPPLHRRRRRSWQLLQQPTGHRFAGALAAVADQPSRQQ